MPSDKVPEGWDEVSPVGEQVAGTPFICFKTPLKPSFRRSWGIEDLLGACPQLAMIIDLTHTDRYYSPAELQERGIDHFKLTVGGGGKLPAENVVANFFSKVDEFMQNRQEGQILGVHCTHGLNRTGYLVCCYLIDRLGLSSDKAIAEFDRSRGESQARQHFLAALRRRGRPQ